MLVMPCNSKHQRDESFGNGLSRRLGTFSVRLVAGGLDEVGRWLSLVLQLLCFRKQQLEEDSRGEENDEDESEMAVEVSASIRNDRGVEGSQKRAARRG